MAIAADMRSHRQLASVRARARSARPGRVSRVWAWALALCLSLACIACGSHDSSSGSKEGGQAQGGTSGSSDAGTSGPPSRRDVERNAAGREASGEAAAGDGGGAQPSIICGTKKCSAPPPGLMQLAGGLPIPGIPVPVACCIDGADGPICGTAASATSACEARAVEDPRCPQIDPGELAAFSGGNIVGCCVMGACGIDAALFGRGCIENGQAAAQLAAIPFLSGLVSVPSPRPCDPDANSGGEEPGAEPQSDADAGL